MGSCLRAQCYGGTHYYHSFGEIGGVGRKTEHAGQVLRKERGFPAHLIVFEERLRRWNSWPALEVARIVVIPRSNQR